MSFNPDDQVHKFVELKLSLYLILLFAVCCFSGNNDHHIVDIICHIFLADTAIYHQWYVSHYIIQSLVCVLGLCLCFFLSLCVQLVRFS